ncbi:hypothetical protein ASPCADRAFT_127499 [Aspergillus carbonarius ITEM 5010]|uniref:Uncharacterized protein n=1 Tax=Aspergillus carbonarius (strain ITEM 5010) TaxID=602072 RepID=A0A1R3RWT9_ASPC5|nr:hypothetical protein ASPCADRAFT_127499 [Aspergillus carbonarius ITEM 5010]
MPSGRRSLLYGGGSRRDPPGVGEPCRTGLRDASRLDTRLKDRAVIGPGDIDMSRRNGPMGTVDAGRLEGLRTGDGLGLLVYKSLVLVLVVHRGRLVRVDGVWTGGRTADLRVAGVGVTAPARLGDGAGSVVVVALGSADFLLVSVAAACGMPEYRRIFDIVVRAAELTELPRRLDVPMGVADPLRGLAGVMTTDEAGELPGVSATLPVRGLSIVTMLEIESRRCCDRTKLMSSSQSSIARILAFNASTREVISDSSRRVSPFTVSRSLTPLRMMPTTRSIAAT